MAQKGLFPISRERHGNRFWQRFTSFDFARPLTEAPVVGEEILRAASAFPIIFRRTGAGIGPVALLSLVPEQGSPFVAPQGHWRASYVPAALRGHPFHAQPSGQQDEMALLVDEASGLITADPRDERFFLPDGTIAPGLTAVVQFFRARERAALETAALCATLDTMGLFTPLPAYEGVALPGGGLGIDLAKLTTLPESQAALLLRSGALRLVHAHQVSLHHCHWLYQAEVQAAGPSESMKQPPAPGLDGFLCALARAADDLSGAEYGVGYQESRHV
ncbi:MAG: SapC family protein [Pseudomonadota bacterium]